jgi:hypothetical protein
MNIPGFTAEASVCKTPGNYQMAGTPNDLAGNRGVVPQISFCRRAFRGCLRGYQPYAEGPSATTAPMWCDLYFALC